MVYTVQTMHGLTFIILGAVMVYGSIMQAREVVGTKVSKKKEVTFQEYVTVVVMVRRGGGKTQIGLVCHACAGKTWSVALSRNEEAGDSLQRRHQ